MTLIGNSQYPELMQGQSDEMSRPMLAPEQIKRIREKNRVSQSIFANHLNTSPSTVQKWETGAKQPSGMALKLLAIVQKHGLAILS
jgi:putative transcriptional regulator